jgi:hypothetical protein
VKRLPAIALIVVMLTVGAIGCSRPDDTDDATSGDGVASSVVGTFTSDADAAPGDATWSDPDSADGSGSAGGTSDSSAVGSGASAADTSAVLRELEAVRRELDAISLPDDTDFSDIEAALR